MGLEIVDTFVGKAYTSQKSIVSRLYRVDKEYANRRLNISF